MNDSSTGREADPVGAGGDARTSWSLMRTGFGPLLIASVGLLTIVLAGSVNGCQEVLFSGCEDAVLVFGL